MDVRRLLPHAAAAILALMFAGPAAAAADDASPASSGATTWSLSPGTATGPDTRVSLRHVIDPGQSVADFVVLTNYSAHAATFDVYASDGLVTPAGDFDLLPPGETAVDGGSWIEIGTVESGTVDAGTLSVQLEPEASVVIPIEITVPADATPGDHPAGVVAEYAPDDAGSVQLANRVGVRTHLRVAGDVVAVLDARDVAVTYEMSWNPFAPGALRVEHRVDNSGNVRLGADSHVDTSGPFGIAAAGSSAQIREVLPGQVAPASTTLDVWPLFVTFGEITVQPLVVGDDEVGETTATTASFTAVTVPWSQLALLVLIAAAVTVGVLIRRRTKSRLQQRIDEAVARARAEAAGPVSASPEDAPDSPASQPALAAPSASAGTAVDARMASRG